MTRYNNPYHDGNHKPSRAKGPYLEVPKASAAGDGDATTTVSSTISNPSSQQLLLLSSSSSSSSLTSAVSFRHVLQFLGGLVLLGVASVTFLQSLDESDEQFDNNPNTVEDTYLTAADYAASFANVVATSATLDDGQACLTALDCASGKWCAFPSWHNMTLRVCCDEALHLGLVQSSSSSALLLRDNNDDEQDNNDDEPAQQLRRQLQQDDMWMTVCTGAAVGEACGSHHALCATGRCIHGKCAAKGLPDGRTCPDDLHCKSGACGRYAYNTTRLAPYQCCPAADTDASSSSSSSSSSGAATPPMIVPGVPYPVSFCHRSAGPGAPCGGYHEICRDGFYCNNQGTCQQQTLR